MGVELWHCGTVWVGLKLLISLILELIIHHSLYCICIPSLDPKYLHKYIYFSEIKTYQAAKCFFLFAHETSNNMLITSNNMLITSNNMLTISHSSSVESVLQMLIKQNRKHSKIAGLRAC